MKKWPSGFSRVPNEEWTKLPLEDLALKYDSVEHHGWYDNLDLTVQQVADRLNSNDIIIDYSGGTGIWTRRFLDKIPDSESVGVIIVDSSPKFLRLAYDKFHDDSRVAFRLIKYLKNLKRLELLNEVIDNSVYQEGVDKIISTNAIHLYYGLDQTLQSWRDILKTGGEVFVQSGNIRNSKSESGSWIIDETVEEIHQVAIEIVQSCDEYLQYRDCIKDKSYMIQHDDLRKKYFLPVRDVEYYQDIFANSKFKNVSCDVKTILAKVDDWYSFLEVYHEGVLGWIGGAEKITQKLPTDQSINDRKALMKLAMNKIFNSKDTFKASWTYMVYQK